MRVFIAINLSNSLRKKIGVYLEKLMVELGQKVIRWVKPAGMHFTVKFIGETPIEQVGWIINTISDIAEQTERFEIHISGLGCFPNCDRPRVITIGLTEPSGELLSLHTRLDAGLSKSGIKRDKRDFHPHLTIGRIRRQTPMAVVKSLGQEINSRHAVDLGIEAVEEIFLIKSELRPDGAVYTVLSSHALGISQR